MKNAIVITSLLFILSLTINVNAQGNVVPLGANLENFDYPFPVKYFPLTIQFEDLKMAYMDIESIAPTGKTILLLHGKNFSGAYWETTANALTKKGYRVIIPDQIGFGKSSKPEQIQYSFHLLATNTKALLDSLGISKCVVLGHSMGGMLATRFALMYPEVTDKLILENPIGLEDYKLFTPYNNIDYWYENELKSDYNSIRKYQLENYYGNKWKPEYDRWVEMLAGWTLSPDYSRIAWNAALTYDMIITQPVLYEFSLLKCPTLLIIGLRDRTAPGKNSAPADIKEKMGNYPELGRKTAQVISQSKLVEINDVGHLPHIEAFTRFIDPVIDFLSTKR